MPLQEIASIGRFETFSEAEASRQKLIRKNFEIVANFRVQVVGNTFEVGPGQFPYTVALMVRETPQSPLRQFCGGTLIQSKKVLTAGHCNLFPKEQMFIAAGQRDLSLTIDAIGISDFKPHGSYEAVRVAGKLQSIRNDIAVITLDRPVTNVPIASLAPTAPAANSRSTVVGWGVTSLYTNRGSEKLLGARVDVKAMNVCSSVYGERFKNDQMLCAGYAANDSCNQDSGGPLILFDSSRQAGIVSFGFDVTCGDSSKPAVYTNVANYLLWINSNL